MIKNVSSDVIKDCCANTSRTLASIVDGDKEEDAVEFLLFVKSQ